jgi:exosortase
MDSVDNNVMERAPVAPPPSFWSELQAYWARVPEKWLFLTMMAGWCVLFQWVGISSFNFGTTRPSLFEWLYNAWNEPAMDCGHGLLIPFVVAALFWVKRRELAASLAGVWWPGLAVVALALLIHVLGFLAQQPRLSMVALFLGLYGMIGAVWGWRTMWMSFFPMVLFGFCMPLGNVTDHLTMPLRMFSVTCTRLFCHGVFDFDVVQQGTLLLDGKGQYEFDVAAACSGIRSFVALLALTTVVAVLSFRSMWRRAVMLVATVPLVVLCNVLRLVVVVVVAKVYGQAAGKWVHDWFGYVTFLVAIGSLMGMAHWLREKPSPASP